MHESPISFDSWVIFFEVPFKILDSLNSLKEYIYMCEGKKASVYYFLIQNFVI